MLGGIIPEETMRDITLPLNSDKKYCGIGITSSVKIASSAFLASTELTEDLVTCLNQSVPAQADPGVRQSFEDWKFRANDETSLEHIISSQCLQKALTADFHRRVQDSISKGDYRTVAFRAYLTAPGEKYWAKLQPTPALQTKIGDRDMRTWFFCRILLFNENTIYPRRGCTAILDSYGAHLLHCASGFALETSTRIW